MMTNDDGRTKRGEMILTSVKTNKSKLVLM